MNQPLIDAYLDELLAPATSDPMHAGQAAGAPAREDDGAHASVADAVADATADALAVALLDDVELPPVDDVEADAASAADAGSMTHTGRAAGDAAVIDGGVGMAGGVDVDVDLKMDADVVVDVVMATTAGAAVESATASADGHGDPDVAPHAAFDADALAAELLAEFDRDVAAASAVVNTPRTPVALAPSAPPAAFELPESFAPVPPSAPIREPVPAARTRSSTGGVAHPGRWLRVCVDQDRYAVELLRVQEVVRIVPIVAMRGADPAVLGVMNLRGRIVPVFDLGLWLGTTAVCPDERARIVVVERDDELIGLLVTAVNDVVTLTQDHIEPPLGAGTPGAIVGVARANDAPTVLLDANGLFD